MGERHAFSATVTVPDDGEGMYVEVPEDVYVALGGKGRIHVRGTFAGVPFEHSVLRYAGMRLMTITKPLREASGVAVGDVVEVMLERDESR